MATEFSMLSIMNAALVSQGQLDVSENDGTDEWRSLFRNWPFIVEAELEDGRYNFTRVETQLLSRIDGKFGFKDGYLVDRDALSVRRIWVQYENATVPAERYFPDYISDGSYVYLDHPGDGFVAGVYAEILTAADEAIWSANFARGVQLKLEAVVAKSIKEEFAESQNLDKQAETHFQRARTHSSKQRTATEPFRKGKLARARGRRWHG